MWPFTRKPKILPVTWEEVNRYCSPASIFILNGSRATLNKMVRRQRGDAIIFDVRDCGKPRYSIRDFGPGAQVREP